MISYKFSNLVGTVYSGGNILFTEQQNPTDQSITETILLSPVGNKLTVFDLTNNVSQTLPFQNRSNIDRIEISPDRRTLITIDVDGYALFINFVKKVVIAHFNFKAPVTAFAFSPDSRFFIVATKGSKVKVFEVPSVDHKVYSPLVLYKKYGNLHSEEITGVTWTTDSRFFLTWSDDLTLKMMSLHKLPGYLPFTFGGNKKKIIKAFFNEDNTRIFTISQNGTLLLWKWTDERSEGVQKQLEFQEFKMQKRLKTGSKPNEYVPIEDDKALYSDLEKRITQGRFILEKKTKFNLKQGSRIASCDYNSNNTNKIMVIGQSNGVFALFNMDTLESVHSFQISEHKIHSISINNTGEWIALASKEMGQLFVWEWKSETYVMKQQGHFFDLNTLAYSPDGSLIATGGDDGKVKLWTTKNCLCFVTFAEHTAQITDLKFIPKKGNAILSASLDGTVRAYDLVKYRCFRVMQPNKPTQFNCLAIDNTGDIVCAGSMDPFNVYVWSLRTGQLIDILNGHTAPISTLQFANQGSLLASGSWDQTVRVWDIFEKKGIIDTLGHSSEVVSLDFHPNNRDLVSTTLSGQIYLWQADEGHLLGIIDCKDDIAGGRLRDDRVSAKNSTKNKHFNSISLSPNGDFILGGGNSKIFASMICVLS